MPDLRNRMTLLLLVGALLCATATAATPAIAVATAPTTAPAIAPASAPSVTLTAEEALKQLQDGNARFVAGQSQHPRADAARREETARNGQHPIATILACSDSRAALDVVMDQGIGDIFTVRVAGNVAGTDEIGSIEYGAGHLGTPLLVVMGHSKCGAVTAVCQGDEVHGSIPALVSKIVPAVKKTQAAHPDLHGTELVPSATEANVWQAIDDVFGRSKEVRTLVKEGKLKVIGAVHDLESGKVNWLGEPADLPRLLKDSAGAEHGDAHEVVPQNGHAQQLPAQPAHAQAKADVAPASHVAQVVKQESTPPEHAKTPVVQAGVVTGASDSARAGESSSHTSSASAAAKAKAGESNGFSPWYLALVFGAIVTIGFIVSKFMHGSSGSHNSQQGEVSMFRNMKLGAKIGAGFAALIVIALALGGLAVWSMTTVKGTVVNLADAKVPTVKIANEVERDSLHTMYAMRGYSYSEDKTFLDQMRKSLEGLKGNIKQAKEHGSKFNETGLSQNTEKASVKVAEYEQLANDTVTRVEALNKDRVAMVDAAAKYVKATESLMDVQTKKLDDEIKQLGAGATAQGAATITDEKVLLRVKKLLLANDIADLGSIVRIGNWMAQAERDPKLFQETVKKIDLIYAKLDELKPITTQAVDLQTIEDIRAASKAYQDAMSGFLANWLTREDLNKKRGEVGEAVLTAAKDTSETGMNDTAEASQHAASSLSMASTTMIVGLSIGVLVGVLLAVFITRSITKPIGRIIAGMTSGSEQTASAAAQVSSASQSLAQGASEQAAAIEETTSSVEEMSSMTKQNAANANEAKTLAGSTKVAADKGGLAMGKMSQAIEDIKKSSDRTAKIVKTIDEIAFQTNLLALNAAVEAARAGEAGKGFAVVAEEVRNLAQRSAEAAKNTATMIEESVKNADNGVHISQDVGQALSEIGEAAGKVNDLVAEIAAASNEQAQGIEQISTAVGQMDSVTQQNAANAEESASASEELSAQAEELSKMVQELMAMVGGADSAGSQAITHRAAHTAVAAHSQAPHAVHAASSKKTGGKRKATPDQQMPGGVAHSKRLAVTGEGDAASQAIPLSADEELAKF